jgi:hypothetical protein
MGSNKSYLQDTSRDQRKERCDGNTSMTRIFAKRRKQGHFNKKSDNNSSNNNTKFTAIVFHTSKILFDIHKNFNICYYSSFTDTGMEG